MSIVSKEIYVYMLKAVKTVFLILGLFVSKKQGCYFYMNNINLTMSFVSKDIYVYIIKAVKTVFNPTRFRLLEEECYYYINYINLTMSFVSKEI